MEQMVECGQVAQVAGWWNEELVDCQSRDDDPGVIAEDKRSS